MKVKSRWLNRDKQTDRQTNQQIETVSLYLSPLRKSQMYFTYIFLFLSLFSYFTFYIFLFIFFIFLMWRSGGKGEGPIEPFFKVSFHEEPFITMTTFMVDSLSLSLSLSLYIYIHVNTHIHTQLHSYVRACVHTYIHTYIHS